MSDRVGPWWRWLYRPVLSYEVPFLPGPAMRAEALKRSRILYSTWRARAVECRQKIERQPHDEKRQRRDASLWERAADELASEFSFLPDVEPVDVAAAVDAERERVLAEVGAALRPVQTFDADKDGEQVGAYYVCDVEEALKNARTKLRAARTYD